MSILSVPRRLLKSPRPQGRVALLALITTIAASGCRQSRWGLPNPATKQGEEVVDLWRTSLYIATVLGVVVFALLFYSMIRHRRRNEELPKQTDGSVKWEITYTVIPFLIVGFLFVYGFMVQEDETKLSANPDVRIEVTGYQWNWRFAYPADNISVVGDNQTLPEMVMPVDQKVQLHLVAADVAHSFFVPGFLTKRDLIPGVDNKIEVTTQHLGTFIGHCAEFCGLNHSQMNFQVRIVSQADYTKWLQQQKQAQQEQQASGTAS